VLGPETDADQPAEYAQDREFLEELIGQGADLLIRPEMRSDQSILK